MANMNEKPKRITGVKKGAAVLAAAWTGIAGINGLVAADAHFEAQDARAKGWEAYADRQEEKRNLYLGVTGVSGAVALINAGAAYMASRTEEQQPDIPQDTLPQPAAPPPRVK